MWQCLGAEYQPRTQFVCISPAATPDQFGRNFHDFKIRNRQVKGARQPSTHVLCNQALPASPPAFDKVSLPIFAAAIERPGDALNRAVENFNNLDSHASPVKSDAASGLTGCSQFHRFQAHRHHAHEQFQRITRVAHCFHCFSAL